MIDLTTSYRSSGRSSGALPRDATRGGVKGPASPGPRGRESPLWINRLESSNRAGD
jgi:hypothetical protein